MYTIFMKNGEYSKVMTRWGNSKLFMTNLDHDITV